VSLGAAVSSGGIVAAPDDSQDVSVGTDGSDDIRPLGRESWWRRCSSQAGLVVSIPGGTAGGSSAWKVRHLRFADQGVDRDPAQDMIRQNRAPADGFALTLRHLAAGKRWLFWHCRGNALADSKLAL
jgi:hypothetical protein